MAKTAARVKRQQQQQQQKGKKREASIDGGGITTKKKHRRMNRHRIAERQILKQQKSSKYIIPKVTISRLVRRIAADKMDSDVFFQDGVFEIIHRNVEKILISILDQAKIISDHDKGRVTTMGKDIELVLKINQKIPSEIASEIIGFSHVLPSPYDPPKEKEKIIERLVI